MIRTSSGRSFSPPTRRNAPSSSTRSSLACRLNSISPISSKKIVPPCGLLEKAFFPLFRVGESTFFVAEKLRFDQCRGQGRAIDREVRAFGPLGRVMDRPWRKVLARAGLALSRIGQTSDSATRRESSVAFFIAADSPMIWSKLNSRYSRSRLICLTSRRRSRTERVLQRNPEFFQTDRLAYKVVGSAAQCRNHIRDIDVPGRI